MRVELVTVSGMLSEDDLKSKQSKQLCEGFNSDNKTMIALMIEMLKSKSFIVKCNYKAFDTV